MTHNEIRAEYVGLMGQDLGQLFHELEDQVSWLHYKWNELKELFGQGQDRIDLLNHVASNFFFFVQQTMFENVLLHLCRLTDPPKTFGKKPNLSLLSLAESISDASLRRDVTTATQILLKNSEFARDWRNRRLAHTDLTTFRNQHSTPLPPVDAKSVEDALRSFGDLFDLIWRHYGHSPTLFTFHTEPWGAKTLVHYLEEAVRVEKEENARWRKLVETEPG